MAMSFVAHSKAGRRFIVAGLWNNSAADINQQQFTDLMTRLLDQLEQTRD